MLGSAGVAQSGGYSIDGNEDTAARLVVDLAGTPAAQQFDLHVVQGRDIGEAMRDRARHLSCVVACNSLEIHGESSHMDLT